MLISGAMVYRGDRFERSDVAVWNGQIERIADFIDPSGVEPVFHYQDAILLPGLVDVHVHLREPGFSYKETIETGTNAAARGGYSAVCAMPNLSPIPDSLEPLREELRRIESAASVRVYPYGALTKGEMGADPSAIDEMGPFVCGFSDDGRGVQDGRVMREVMRRVRDAGGIVAAHCEDEKSIRPGGCVHEGEAERKFSLIGIPSQSEWMMLERDLRLAEQTGCRYHVCHVSAKESVALIRDAKRRGLDVSCETAPHYLLLSDSDLRDEGRFKMNPPIRSQADREALVEGVLDGTIDMIATDHAPHTSEEKDGGLRASLNGIVGLEGAFALLYTHFVKKGIFSLEKLVDLMAVAPRRRFRLPGGDITPGAVADLSVFSLKPAFSLDSGRFASKGRSTPFDGWRLFGETRLTLVGGEVAYAVSGGAE